MKKTIAITATIFALAAAARAQDIQSPTVNMEAPVNGVEVTNNTVTITGEATDDTGVAAVYYRIEGQRRWRKAILTNPDSATTSYVFTTKLSKGRARRIYIRAFDAAENESDILGRKIRRAKNR